MRVTKVTLDSSFKGYNYTCTCTCTFINIVNCTHVHMCTCTCIDPTLLHNGYVLPLLSQAKVLLAEDYGKDLSSVEALIRRHEEVERDLTVIEDKLGVSTTCMHVCMCMIAN